MPASATWALPTSVPAVVPPVQLPQMCRPKVSPKAAATPSRCHGKKCWWVVWSDCRKNGIYVRIFLYLATFKHETGYNLGQLDAWLRVWAPNEGPNTSRWLSLSHVPLEDTASKYTWKLGFWMRFCVRNEGKSINKTAILVMRQANVCLELGAAMFQNGALSSPGVVWTRYG